MSAFVNFMNKIIKGERITLRPLNKDDWKIFLPWFSDRAIMRYFGQWLWKISGPKLCRHFQDIIEHKEPEVFFSILLDGRVIGGVGAELFNFDFTGDFWVMIGDQQQWGKGYATEATKLFLDYFFGTLKYHRLELTVTVGYEKALHIYKKMGFRQEGIKRESDWNRIMKKFEDEYLYSYLSSDWKKFNK